MCAVVPDLCAELVEDFFVTGVDVVSCASTPVAGRARAKSEKIMKKVLCGLTLFSVTRLPMLVLLQYGYRMDSHFEHPCRRWFRTIEVSFAGTLS